jgi:hypothetical protein
MGDLSVRQTPATEVGKLPTIDVIDEAGVGRSYRDVVDLQEAPDRFLGEAGLSCDLRDGHSPLLVALDQKSTGEDIGGLPVPLCMILASPPSAHLDAVLQHSLTDRKAGDTEPFSDLGRGKASVDVQVEEPAFVNGKVLTGSCHGTSIHTAARVAPGRAVKLGQTRFQAL